MVTGASHADLAIILVDARQGILPQTQRHAALVGLLRIPHVALAVNKMDLVGFDRAVFERLRDEFLALAAPLGFESVTPIPLSALEGDMVVERGTRLDWYEGPTLLQLLETVATDAALGRPVALPGAARLALALRRARRQPRLPRPHRERLGLGRRRGARVALGRRPRASRRS